MVFTDAKKFLKSSGRARLLEIRRVKAVPELIRNSLIVILLISLILYQGEIIKLAIPSHSVSYAVISRAARGVSVSLRRVDGVSREINEIQS